MKRPGSRRPSKPRGAPGSGKRRTDPAQKAALKKVQTAIRQVKPELPLRAITAEASLVADLGVDSLKFAELSIALENVFGEPVFLGDVLADIEDPSAITVGDLAEHLAGSD